MLFADRLEVFNPGSLVPELSVARLQEEHASCPTNLLLTEILYQTGYIERFLTGTGEMYRLCEEAGLDKPKVTLDEGFRISFARKSKVELPGGATHHETHHERSLITEPAHGLACIVEGKMFCSQLSAAQRG